MILNSLMMVSMIFVMITMAGESAKRIAEVLTEKSTLTDPANPIREVADGSIEFDHVSFRYSAKASRMGAGRHQSENCVGRNNRHHRRNRAQQNRRSFSSFHGYMTPQRV